MELIVNNKHTSDLDYYVVTIYSQLFKNTEHYNAVKTKFLNISSKLQFKTRMQDGHEIFSITLDPNSVDSRAEYYRLLSKMSEMVTILSTKESNNT